MPANFFADDFWPLIAQTAPQSSIGFKLGLVAGMVAISVFLGWFLGRTLRVRDMSFKMGALIFVILVGISPFLNKLIDGRPPQEAIKLGIDLAGGTNLVYQLDREAMKAEKVSANASDLMSRMVAAITRRINPDGTKEVTVRQVGADRIEVIVPGADPEEVGRIKRLMTDLGTLEFAILANQRDHKQEITRAMALKPNDKEVRINNQIVARWVPVKPIKQADGTEVPNPHFSAADEIAVRDVSDRERAKLGFKEALVIMEPDPNKRITGRFLRRVSPTSDESGRPAVGFHFNSQGGYLFRRLTRENAPMADGFERRLAAILDENIESAPTIRSEIGADGIIQGRFTAREVDQLVKVLNAGSLPVQLQKTPISEFTISPTLGTDVQEKGKLALVVSAVAVIVFMTGYYLFAGLVADFAMLLNLLLIVAIMSIIDAAFTLPGLAGLVLTAGMAVDANVLIYERIREELARGSSLRLAIHNGFDRALTAIVDSNVTTLISAVILYMIGSDQVRGFAVSLFIGLVINLYTAVTVSRMILEICERKRWITRLKMLQVIGHTNVDFVVTQSINLAPSAA